MRRRPLILFAIAILAGCDNGHSTPVAGIIAPHSTATPTTSPTTAPSPTPAPSATPPVTGSSSCTNPMQASIGATGGFLTASAATGTITQTIAPGALAASTTVTYCYVPQASLPAPLLRAPRQDKSGRRTPMFTAGAGNTYVAAFTTTFGGATLSSAASETGTGVAPSLAAGTQLNIAMYNGTTWVDIATAVVSAGGNYASTTPTVALPGVTANGTYLVYVPATGTNTSQLNLGFALVADDGTASIADGLQFVQVENNGAAVPTPTTTFFPVTGSDLDGQSLTPDAEYGAAIDGGDNVYFFSGLPQHTFTLGANPINVSSYGGDGDSIVSLPNGDEAVVTADGGSTLAVISSILTGSPVISDTIPTGTGGTEYRDGLVIATDGTTMLSRGQSGIDVYKVASVPAHAGTTMTGTTSYNFSLTTTLASGSAGQVPTPYLEDGRDEMAMSPVDASRAVVAGYDTSDKPEIVLLTGLNGATPAVSALHPQFAPRPHRLGENARHPEAMPHRAPFALTPTAGTTIYAITVSPDGTTAYASTDAGIITISGVNTGTLAQVGTPYSPAISGTSSCTLASAPTLGILPDGKFLITEVNCGITPGSTDSSQGSGVLLTIPIGAGGVLGAPVGQLNNVVVPNNDQMIVH